MNTESGRGSSSAGWSNDLLFYILFTGKNTVTVKKATSSAPLAQSFCFRGGFKACHKTSCIVNSAASMADWWAICLVDCLAPGPWSYVYVWALLFHMYRPRIIFYCPPPTPISPLAELMAYTQRHKRTLDTVHRNTHVRRARHITSTLRVMTCTRGQHCPSRLHYCQYK